METVVGSFVFHIVRIKLNISLRADIARRKPGDIPFVTLIPVLFCLLPLSLPFHAMIVSFQSPSVLLDFAPRAGSVSFQSTPSADGEKAAVSAGL